MSHHSFEDITSEDAKMLNSATDLAVQTISVTSNLSEKDRADIADAVLWIAKSGYARTSRGALDVTSLSEAAVARFHSVD
jgi:hypothetical protein